MSDDMTDFESTASPQSRERLTYHPYSNTFRMMTEVELKELAADIEKNGLQQPIVLYEGLILDGRNRHEACLMAGVAPITTELPPGNDPIAFVISINAHRRHLTQTEKQDAIARLLAAHPEQSDRAIAKLAHVDHKTVSATRADMVGRGEIPHVHMRADSKGRSYPASKKRAAGSSPVRPAIGSAEAVEVRDTGAVSAFPHLLSAGDIYHHLNDLLRLLADEKKHIAAVPQIQRVELARGFLGLLDISPDDLRPIETMPAFEGGQLSSEARSS